MTEKTITDGEAVVPVNRGGGRLTPILVQERCPLVLVIDDDSSTLMLHARMLIDLG